MLLKETIGQIRDRLLGLLRTPREELTGWARFAQTQMRLWRFCAKQLRRHNSLAMSAALSFRTIFAMVPALVLFFLTIKSMGFVEEKKALLERIMEESGWDQIVYKQATLSEKAVTLSDFLMQTIRGVEEKLTVGALGPIGVVLLIWTALTLLTTTERSLNRIFEAERPRPFLRRILLYWSTLTLGPLLVVLAFKGASWASGAASAAPNLKWIVDWLGSAGAFLVGVGVLAFVYQLVPNTTVSLRAAGMGAVVAFPLFLIAKWAFGLYVGRVAPENLYGAMGLVPLFFLWLNASWWLFLFGAQIAHTVANLGRMVSAEEASQRMLGGWDMLATVVSVGRAHRAGAGPMQPGEIAGQIHLSLESIQRLVER